MIYLMLHGADSPDRLGGWSPYGLSDEGIRQVNAAKEKPENFWYMKKERTG